MASSALSPSLWAHRVTFVVFALLILVVQLVPIDLRPARGAPPDLLLPFALAWMARRPDYLPVWVVAGLFLIADMLLLRPPGLYAALVVILTEKVRRRALERRFTTLAGEWGTVALGIVTVALVYRVILFATMVPQAPLGQSLIQTGLTVAVYPLVVFVTHYLFGVTRPAPSETDERGRVI